MRIGPETPALVAGGASGLGAAVVRRLRAAGAPVTILDRDAAAGQALAAETGAGFAPGDVTEDAGVVAALDGMAPPRIVVNCAGIAPAMKVAGTRGPHDMALFARVLAVNLGGTMRVMALAADRMRALVPLGPDGARGVVVNTASAAAFDGQMGQAAYAASKGGVAALTLPAARDLAGVGIRVCAIAPGIFATPMLAGLPDEVQASLAAQVPCPPRLGDPAEFAAAVAFVIECGYMNGEVIRLDGALRMAAR